MLLLVLVVSVMEPVTDPDTFWHIAAGDFVRAHWTFSGPDPWSDMSSRPWRLHEWLPQLGMSAVHDLGGLTAVAWLLPLGVAGILLALWYWLRRTSSLLTSTLVVAATFIAMSESLAIRPHLITFALTVISTGAWLKTSEDQKLRWWLLPMTWIWACSHGMWFVGPVIGFVVLAGMALDRVVDVRKALRLSALPIASIVAASVTPVGPELLLSPMQVGGYTSFISEWQPASLGEPGITAFLALCAVAIFGWGRGGQRVPWPKLLLLALATGLALKYGRTVPVGAAIIAPIAAATLHELIGFAREPLRRRETTLTLSAAAAGLAVAGFLGPSTVSGQAAGANDLSQQLAALPVGTSVCNTYELGGWLIWKHHNIRPAVDGRTEVYAIDYFQQYLKFHSAQPGWESYTATVGCRYALLSRTDAPAAGLVKQEGWTVIQAGEKYVLLREP